MFGIHLLFMLLSVQGADDASHLPHRGGRSEANPGLLWRQESSHSQHRQAGQVGSSVQVRTNFIGNNKTNKIVEDGKNKQKHAPQIQKRNNRF